jgi:hypothetical protein
LFFAPDPERDSDESAAAAAAAVDAGLVQGEPHVHLGNTNPTNPCWQDIYDDDCAMSTMYSASFIAKNWIKAMPCAEGIEVCIAYCCRKEWQCNAMHGKLFASFYGLFFWRSS